MSEMIVGKVVLSGWQRLPSPTEVDEDVQIMALRRHLLGAIEALDKLIQKKGLTQR